MTSELPSDPSAQPVPLCIMLASAGLFAITALVVGAVGIRTLLSRSSESESAPSVAATAPRASAGSAERPRPPPGAAAGPEVGRALRSQLDKDLEARRYGDFIAHLEQLLEVDPTAAQDREIRAAIVDVVLMRIMVGGEEIAEKLFDLVQHRMGTTGIDMLYELVTTHGGSLAAKRAAELLRDESVRARGTPALRIAYDLRLAPCEAKRALFERASTDGDKRALDQLAPLDQRCGRRNRGCCMHDDPGLNEAIAAIKARLP